MSGLVEIILPVFALITCGYLLRRLGVLSGEAAEGLGRLVFSLLIPALLFRSLAFQDIGATVDLRITLVYFGGCFLILAVSMPVGRFGLGLDRAEAGVFGLAAMYSNSSLLGVPIIHAVFGASGLLLLGKIIAFHSLLLLPTITLIICLARNEGRLGPALGRSVLATLGNPIVLGLAAGLAWNMTKQPLWKPVDHITGMLAEAATPLALLSLGALQVRAGLEHIKRAGASVFLKLVVHPVLVYGLAILVGGLTPEAIAVATITAALPAGMNVSLMAQQHGCYITESTVATSFGTLLSMASLTAVLELSGRFT